MTRKLFTVDEFRAATKDGGNAPDGIIMRAATNDPEAIDDTKRSVRFIFSDATVDRSGDSIAADGWVTDQFLKNPVALWAHDSMSPPIGRASNVGVVNGKLMGDIEFMPEDISPFADSIFRMVAGRYLRAVSVGFMPLKYAFVNNSERPWGIDFEQQELLEISVCPIPCNPNALQEARSKGIDTAPLREWAERLLDGGSSVLVPRAVLEDTFRKAKTPPAIRQKYLSGSSVRSNASDWSVGTSRDLPIDGSDTWDGPAAAERMLDDAGFNGDSPDSAKARRGFLIYDSANPGLKGSYKLPFADIVGGELKAVAAGARAAASRLPQTDAPQAVLDDARKVLDDYEAKMSKAVRRGVAFQTLVKDLDNVAWLASLLQSLACLAEWIEWEEQSEGDGSDMSARLGAVLNEIGQILVDMTAEEVAELLGGDEAEAADPFDMMLMSASTPGQKLTITLAQLAHGKAGRRISADNQALLAKAMDHHASATQCVKDVLDSNATDEPASDDPMVIQEAVEDERAKRISEARALKEAVKI